MIAPATVRTGAREVRRTREGADHRGSTGWRSGTAELLAILLSVGLDPTRKHRASTFDYWYVTIGIVVVIGLLIWALLS
jgi:hypothetical protein